MLTKPKWRAVKVAAAPAIALAFSLALSSCEKPARDASAEDRSRAVASTEPTAQSGRILGVAIGDTVDAARAILDPLRDPAASYPPDQKELEGRRTYWKLAGTDYDWIMVWAKEGKITRVRAVLRPDRLRPFGSIGDLKTAAAVDPTSVRWNLRTPSGSNYRLVAQGANEMANTVFMFALE